MRRRGLDFQQPRVQHLQHKFFPRFLTQKEGLGDAPKRSCGGGMVEGVYLYVIDQFSPDQKLSSLDPVTNKCSISAAALLGFIVVPFFRPSAYKTWSWDGGCS